MNMNLSIRTSVISRILRQYNMVSYIAPRKPRITPNQRRARVDRCNEHLSCSVQGRSKVIVSDESNYQVLNRSNRIYFRQFRTDRIHFERSRKRTHREGDPNVWSFIRCHDPGPRIIFDGCLNFLKYIDLLEEHLPTTVKRFPNNQLTDIIYQQDNAQAHVSKMI